MSSSSERTELFAAELDRLLADWAATRRLTDTQVASIRDTVLSSHQGAMELDADWLWSLLRPVTSLIEKSEGLVPYLQLA